MAAAGSPCRPIKKSPNKEENLFIQLTAKKSARARTKIRQWFTKERREDAVEAGKEALTRAMRKAGVSPLFPAEEHPEFTPGFYSVSFCDPDKNVVEFYAVPTGK